MNVSSLKLKKVMQHRAFGIFAVAIGLILVFYFVFPERRFFDPRAIRTILTRAPEYGIIAIGITFLMISRELDISVGSVFTLCSLVFAFLYLRLGLNPILALLSTLAVGALVGSLNGLISLKFGIPSIITTLGTMYLWRGAALVACRGQPIYYRGAAPFKAILTARLGGFLPMGFVWFIILTVFFEVILHYHRFGNRVRASGGNTQAAREMGISTGRVKLICFALVGFLIAFASIIESTRIGEGSARLGIGYEFYAIAATVIGGTSLFGGVGTVIGTFLGAIILEMIRTGLAVIGIPGWWFSVSIGAIIIVVMILNMFIMKRVRR